MYHRHRTVALGQDCVLFFVSRDSRVGNGIPAHASHRTVLAPLNAHDSSHLVIEKSTTQLDQT